VLDRAGAADRRFGPISNDTLLRIVRGGPQPKRREGDPRAEEGGVEACTETPRANPPRSWTLARLAGLPQQGHQSLVVGDHAGNLMTGDKDSVGSLGLFDLG
jgi:hypothetical protein